MTGSFFGGLPYETVAESNQFGGFIASSTQGGYHAIHGEEERPTLRNQQCL